MLSNTTHLLRIIAVVSAVLTLTQMGVTAQEITYNLTPTHELGSELWQIPISGKLTMSADGKRVLVACLADSAFYMVDVETGAYRKLHSQYFQDNTYDFTQYGTDDQCRWLVIHGTDLRNGVARTVFRVEDTQTGEIVLEQEPGITIRGVSQKQDRLMSNTQLIKLSTFELIKEYPKETPSGLGAWFDDARGLVYRARPREVQEINAGSGEILRSWTVRPTTFQMRRPSNSNWLYVFSVTTDGLPGGSQNFVEAINLTTGERLIFTKYFWSGADGRPRFNDQPRCFTSSSATCFAVGNDGGSHYNTVWEFDAEGARTSVVSDPMFFFYDRYDPKLLTLTPDKSRLLHNWYSDWKDSSILRCNALVPAATSAQDEASASSSNSVIVIQRDNMLTIEFAGASVGEVVQEVQVFSSDGQTVITQRVTDPAVPVTLAIGHLSSGAYRLMVRTTKRQLFSSFTIVR